MKIWQSCKKSVRFKKAIWSIGQNKICATWTFWVLIICWIFIDVSSPCWFKKVSRCAPLIWALKSPINRTFSKLEYTSKALSKVLKKYWSGWEGGWYIPTNSHLLLLKFNSLNKPSILSGKLCFVNILFGICSLTYMIIQTPFLFPSNL